MNLIALIATSGAWLAIALTLVLDLSGRKRRYSGYRWIAASLLLVISFMIFSQIAHARDWPARDLEVTDGFGFLIFAPAVALGLRGYRTYKKTRRHLVSYRAGRD